MGQGLSRIPPLQVGVSAILWRDGRVLMHRRLGSHGSGTWAFPGGHVDPGESPRSAAEREVREETGIALDPEWLMPLTFTSDVFEVEGRRYVTLYFEAACPESAGEPVVMEPAKCGGWEWVRPGDWPGELFLPVQNLLRQHGGSLGRRA